MSTGGFFFSIGQYATGFAAPGLVSGSDSSLAVGFVSIGLVVDCSSCSVVGVASSRDGRSYNLLAL